MQRFLQIFLLSISFLFLCGCITKNFTKQKEVSQFSVSPVLADGYQTALYKTKIDFGDKHFSGLFYFKNYADTVKRIVFMSEIGLNLLDFEYKNNAFRLVSCQEFLNKPIIINTLKSDLKLLVDLPQKNIKHYIYSDTNNKEAIVKINHSSGKYYYFCNQNNHVTKIIKTKGFKRVDILINKYKKTIPEKIKIKHKRIKLGIELNLLKVK